jgi:LytS/YehU family sensor histidine kinase
VVPNLQGRQREGNRMALENIRERLDLAFSGTASMAVNETETRYTVQLKIPMTEGA